MTYEQDIDPAVSTKYVDLSVASMMKDAEIARLRAQLNAQPEPAPTPQPESAYPMRTSDGRIMFGSWDELNDPYFPKNHPRNTPSDAAYRIAARERTLREANDKGRVMHRLVDENGHPIGVKSPWEAYVASVNEREVQALADPVLNAEGMELLHPDLPADDPKNADTSSVQYRSEMTRRERLRNAARINLAAKPRVVNSHSVRRDREPSPTEKHISETSRQLVERLQAGAINLAPER